MCNRPFFDNRQFDESTFKFYTQCTKTRFYRTISPFDIPSRRMYNRLMNYIVFDLEWNQCPDGKEHELRDLPFEILEIGAIKLNSEKIETDRFHEYIRPTVYLRLHSKTQEIVHIDPETLESADFFPAVLERFRKWCGPDAHYCTWGSLDLLELQRNIRYHKLPGFFPFPLKFYDIQKIFSLTFEDGKSRRTLEHAVDMLHIKKNVPFHEALSDAYYTAAVMRFLPEDTLLSYYSIDYFRIPQRRNEEIYETFENYSKYVSKKFPSRTAVMKDRVVRSTTCYVCGKKAVKKIPWFTGGSKHYRCLSYCEEHGWLKGKIRIKKTEDDKSYFCVKTLKLISEERAQEIITRYKERTEKKRDL